MKDHRIFGVMAEAAVGREPMNVFLAVLPVALVAAMAATVVAWLPGHALRLGKPPASRM